MIKLDDVEYYNYCREIDIMKRHYKFYLFTVLVLSLFIIWFLFLDVINEIHISIIMIIPLLIMCFILQKNLNKKDKLFKEMGIKYISDFYYL